MKIAILEAKTVSKGDVSFEEIYRLGDVDEYPLTPAADVVKNIGDAEAVLRNKTVFDEKVLRACPNLKYIGLCATGYNNIDLKTCNELGITVCNVPAYSTAAVAQQVFSFILHFASKTSKYNKFVKFRDLFRFCLPNSGACGQDYRNNRIWFYRQKGCENCPCFRYESNCKHKDCPSGQLR